MVARLVDLSQDLFHKQPGNPGAPPVQVWVWRTHAETKHLHTTGHSSTTRLISFPDHASTHVDAPIHFDDSPDALDIAELPLDRFYGPAICVDVTGRPNPEWIDLADLEAALARHQLDLRPNDIVLIYTGHYRAHYPRPEFFNAYPGLTAAAAYWLHQHGVRNFGVEGPNPGHPSDRNFEVHQICRRTRMIHMENLCNLESLVGRRFTFAGFPLKITNGSGSPIRAVAILDD